MFEEILIIIFLGVGGYVINYFRKRSKCLDTLTDEMMDLKKSQWRISKAIIIMAKLLDEQTEKAHPEMSVELEEIARELLGMDQK